MDMDSKNADRWNKAPFTVSGPPEPTRVMIFFAPWWWVWFLTGCAIGWTLRGVFLL